MIDLGGEQVDMTEIVERKFAGDKVQLGVWRKGKKEAVEVELAPFGAYLMTARQYERRPQYVMFCGLVFQPLDYDLMGAHSLNSQRLRYYFNYYVTDEIYRERPQIIVLTQVLPDAINTHIRDSAPNVVEEINGVKILTLKDVQTALAKEPEGSHVVIKLEGEGRPLVFEKSQIAAAQARVQKKYEVEEAAYVEEYKGKMPSKPAEKPTDKPSEQPASAPVEIKQCETQTDSLFYEEYLIRQHSPLRFSKFRPPDSLCRV
jgi:hypothetical protein